MCVCRFQNGPSSPACWEEIHQRVQRILQRHRTHTRLNFDELGSAEDSARRRPLPSRDESLCRGRVLPQREVAPRGGAVPLKSDTFWSERAAQYAGRSHRAVFEDSLGQVYKELYNNITSTG
ncbi:spermatogenesis-associated protein 6 [Arapaima gigas]